jgi:hypothetical protein
MSWSATRVEPCGLSSTPACRIWTSSHEFIDVDVAVTGPLGAPTRASGAGVQMNGDSGIPLPPWTTSTGGLERTKVILRRNDLLYNFGPLPRMGTSLCLGRRTASTKHLTIFV